MARTYLTPHKSTGGRFPRGQLAPRHRLDDVVEVEPEEIQQRLKSRRIRRKYSRNLRKKIQKKWRWKRNQWSHHSCMMALFWKLMLMVT
jgi:hypothetical protein